MKLFRHIGPLALMATMALGITSCDDNKTYAELLTDENKYVNAFLADQHVINSIPADTNFITGPDAPYYRLDEDGNLYMQVVEPGTPGDTVAYNELIYFRYTRYPLVTYSNGEFTASEGNDAVLNGNFSFRYANFDIASSYNFGVGIQTPLAYLPIDAVVNIVIKSQYGFPTEMSNVQPYLFSIRYYRPKI